MPTSADLAYANGKNVDSFKLSRPFFCCEINPAQLKAQLFPGFHCKV
jgi:hypothetical protein